MDVAESTLLTAATISPNDNMKIQKENDLFLKSYQH
jgi:hypothetical protein